MSLKLPIQEQQPNNGLFDSSEIFRADRSKPDEPFYTRQVYSLCFSFREISQKLHLPPILYFMSLRPCWLASGVVGPISLNSILQ